MFYRPLQGNSINVRPEDEAKMYFRNVGITVHFHTMPAPENRGTRTKSTHENTVGIK
jgi:hypothetical protein